MNDTTKTHVIRFGGLVETFYVTPIQLTCHKSEATKFTEKEATEIAKRLQEEYICGVRAVKA